MYPQGLAGLGCLAMAMVMLERRVCALDVGAEHALLLGLLEARVPLGFVEGQVKFEIMLLLSPADVVRRNLCCAGFLLLEQQGMVQVDGELAHAG